MKLKRITPGCQNSSPKIIKGDYFSMEEKGFHQREIKKKKMFGIKNVWYANYVFFLEIDRRSEINENDS